MSREEFEGTDVGGGTLPSPTNGMADEGVDAAPSVIGIPIPMEVIQGLMTGKGVSPDLVVSVIKSLPRKMAQDLIRRAADEANIALGSDVIDAAPEQPAPQRQVIGRVANPQRQPQPMRRDPRAETREVQTVRRDPREMERRERAPEPEPEESGATVIDDLNALGIELSTQISAEWPGCGVELHFVPGGKQVRVRAYWPEDDRYRFKEISHKEGHAARLGDVFAAVGMDVAQEYAAEQEEIHDYRESEDAEPQDVETE
jgi:hypothetical protein